jgi:predicted alpha/beta-hydrolase family hydrolase
MDGTLCRDAMNVRQIDTPSGPARAHVRALPHPVGALVLGHGAGGGIGARDLAAAAEVAVSEQFTVALVEQPYRVAGRRSPAPARQLDAAWIAVVDALRRDELAGVPLVVGGRSAGARVACRTAEQTQAAAVLCLAFPLLPPRRAAGRPAASRQPELDAVTVATLVVQGAGDPFGMPAPGPHRHVVTVKGNHSLTSDLPAVRAAVQAWLTSEVARQAGYRSRVS